MTDGHYIVSLRLWFNIFSAAIILFSALDWITGAIQEKRAKRKARAAQQRRLVNLAVIAFTALAWLSGSWMDAAKDRQDALQRRAWDVTMGRIKTEVAVQQRRLAETRGRLAQAEQQRAEAQLALEKTLEEVRRRQAPRTLTAEQRSRFVRALKLSGGGRVSIECPLGDGEALAFATELEGLLKAAGWRVGEGGVEQGVGPGDLLKGELIIVGSAKSAPRCAASLQKAFKAIGHPIDGVENPELPDTKIILRIGRKPATAGERHTGAL